MIYSLTICIPVNDNVSIVKYLTGLLKLNTYMRIFSAKILVFKSMKSFTCIVAKYDNFH